MTRSFKRSAAWSVVAALVLVGCNQESATSGTSTTGGAGGGGGEAPELFGQLTLSAKSIDFGMADCGGDAPADQVLTLTNSGTGPLKWDASIDSNAYFDLAGDSLGGVIEAGASVDVTVKAGSMPASSTAGAAQSTTIRISTDSAVGQLFVPVKATAQGATFQLVAPQVADFGQVPGGVAAPKIPVTLKNVGNAPAKVAIGAPADTQFAFEWTGGEDAVDVAPGATMAGLEASFTPTKSAPVSDAGDVVVTGAVCGESALAVPVQGQGLVGAFGVSPGSIDLGKVGCGTTAEPVTVYLYNTGNSIYTWSAAFKNNANFTISKKSGAIGVGGVQTLTITPKGMPVTTNLADNAYGDTLVVTTNLPGEKPYEISVKQTAGGAILKWDATPQDFGTQQAFKTSADAKVITITNEGNLDAKVSVTAAGGITSEPGVAKGAGGTFAAQVKFAPTVLGPVATKMTIATDAPLCAALPKEVAATGAGKGVATAMSMNGPTNRGSGDNGGCLILKDSGGKVACFGINDNFTLGTEASQRDPVIVAGLPEIVQVTAGDNFRCARAKDGTVWCWGRNADNRGDILGKIGKATGLRSAVPVQVPSITDAVDVSAGHNMACVVRSTGVVSCWGTNRRGNLGTGVSGGNLNVEPQDVPGITTATSVAVSAGGGCAVLANETARCWGRVRHSQIGDGGNRDGQMPPTQVALSTIKSISGNNYRSRGGHRCAIYGNGTVACWGANNYGQTGNNSCAGSCRGRYYSPVGVSGITDATQIGTFDWGGCALVGDKTVRCWGRNNEGQVGNGNTSVAPGPVTVPNLTDVAYLAAGGRGACAIKADGSVVCWGNYNGNGAKTAPETLKFF